MKRSNEQLVKIIGLRQKAEGPRDSLSENDKNNLFDLIQEETKDA